MLRYKTHTEPGLVTFYDIRSWNGAGLFLVKVKNTHSLSCSSGVSVGVPIWFIKRCIWST